MFVGFRYFPLEQLSICRRNAAVSAATAYRKFEEGGAQRSTSMRPSFLEALFVSNSGIVSVSAVEEYYLMIPRSLHILAKFLPSEVSRVLDTRSIIGRCYHPSP